MILDWIILSVVVVNTIATIKLLMDNKTVDKPIVKPKPPAPSREELAILHRLNRTREKEKAAENTGPVPHTDLM